MKGLMRNLFVFCVGLVLVALPAEAYGAGFQTDRYDVKLDVSEDNSFYVEENISVNFTSPSHGIYRYIPFTGKMVYQLPDGRKKETNYKVKINDLKTPGFENEISYENNMMLVRIGDPDATLTGPVTYKLRYQVVAHEDGEVQLDQLYWELLSGKWETSIKNADFTIKMPKDFDTSKAEFISGAYGSTDAAGVVWNVEGRTLKGTISRALIKGEGVTLRVVLPEGYFTGERNNDWMATVMYSLIMFAAIVSFLLWRFFGRDQKLVKTVEFYPPEGVTPGEIGYILDGVVDNKDVVSMILHFANEGYLEIQEEEKDNFRLIKKKELAESAETYEHTLFRGLFTGRDSVHLDELKEDFYATFQASKSQLKGKFSKKSGKLIFTKNSIFAQVVAAFVLSNPLFAVAILGVEYRYLSAAFTLLFLPSVLFVIAGFFAVKTLYERKDSSKINYKAGMTIFAFLLNLIGFGSFLLLGAFVLHLILASVLAVLSSVVCMICAVAMKQRTKYSIELMGKILGFKEFIRTAELDRIKKLAEENPQYFYHVLPFAYVFGLTDIWSKKFEGIALSAPDWYQSPYNGNLFSTYVFLNSFNHYTTAMQNSIVIPSSGSVGTLGGGGFTPGGGFSGGGMGSGGGGSW